MNRINNKMNQVTFNVGYLVLSYCVVLISYNNAIAKYRTGDEAFLYLLCVMPIIACCIPLVINVLAKKELVSMENACKDGNVDEEREVEDFLDKVKIIKAMPTISSLFSLGFTIVSAVFLVSENSVVDNLAALLLLTLSSLVGGVISVFVLKKSLEKVKFSKEIKS